MAPIQDVLNRLTSVNLIFTTPGERAGMAEPLELNRVLDEDDQGPGPEARRLLTEKLCEIVVWPSTRISPQERQLAGDLLVGLLRFCARETRLRCAVRLSALVDAPKPVLRYLARDEIDIAAPLLRDSLSLDDVDLIDCIRVATPAHVAYVAQRKIVRPPVAHAIVQRGPGPALDALLRNQSAELAQTTINALLRITREQTALAPLLARREEVRASQGLALFWWSTRDTRALLLRRFATERTTLIAEMSPFFPLSATEAVADPDVRKTLAFIERRQRSRHTSSAFGAATVEALVEVVAANGGFTRASAVEFARMCGVRPATALRVIADPGGEPCAVLAKAIGMKRDLFAKLWSMTRAREGDAQFETASLVFETLSAAKAQTVLRYWDWGMSAEDGENADNAEEDFDVSPARRFLSLIRTQDL